jgi:hypothetical protein
MKKFIPTTLIITSLLFLTGFTKPQEESVSISGPIFKVDESITFTDTIDGDVFLVGGEVTVDATISGDLIIIAGQTDIKGTIGGDLRVLSGRADINSIINDDVTMVSGQLKIHKDTLIKNSLTAVAKILDFSGTASGKTTILGDNIYLNGQAEDNVFITTNKVTIGKNAKVSKNLELNYYTHSNISDQSTISGDLITTKMQKEVNSNNQTIFQKIKPLNKFTLLIFLQQLTVLIIEILVGCLLIILFPKVAKQLNTLSQKDPGLALGWGFLNLLLTPVIGVMFLLTLIGIPVGVLVFLIFSLAVYASKLVISLSLGTKILKDSKLTTPYKNLSLGLVIITALKLIPIIGWLTYFILFLNGLGAITLLAKNSLKKLKK